MTTKFERPVLRLIGTNSSAGGSFRRVKIVGESELHGDTDCEQMNIVGEAVVRGRLRAGFLKMTGECKAEGQVEVDAVKGTGEMDVMGSLKGERVKFSGSLNVQGNCELEQLDLTGGLRVEGLLSAERLELNMFGPCSAQEIGGGQLRIRRSKVAMVKGWIQRDAVPKLRAALIEGDLVELHHTEADVVRGNRVIIGPGCTIGRVEYSRELRVDRHATVDDRVQI